MNAINEIKKAEKEAREMIEDATAEVEKKLAQLDSFKEQSLKEQKAQHNQAMELAFREQKKTLDTEQEENSQKTEQAVSNLHDTSKKNFDTAVEKAVKDVLKSLK